jgi:hypothetical protein
VCTSKFVVTVILNEAGQAQHLVVNHRPRSALLFLSRLMGEKFAGTPIAEHFLTSESFTDERQKEIGPSPGEGVFKGSLQHCLLFRW